MLKRIALLGLILTHSIALFGTVQPPAATITVAWDIDDVLIDKHDQIIQETAEIVLRLHANGVHQVLFSNKPRAKYAQLEAKYPDFFNSTIFDYQGSLVQPLAWYNLGRIRYKKPGSRYISAFLAKQECEPGNIFFIDDKKKNCDACKRHGMQVRHFTNNPEAIHTDLTRLGLV